MSDTVSTTPLATAPSFNFGFQKFVTADLATLRAFYEKALGLAVGQTIEGEGFTELVMRKPGAETGFSLILFHYTDGRKITVGDGHGPMGFFVRDVDAAYAHALANGAKPDRVPYDTGNMRVAFVRDPDGREIELISMKR